MVLLVFCFILANKGQDNLGIILFKKQIKTILSPDF